ncbi:MAG: hypothetical protein M1817_002701 [Caeruleum heppii]|nr:MAG: hypothetical protein M1817_002701 [Caeruleum heppii]
MSSEKDLDPSALKAFQARRDGLRHRDEGKDVLINVLLQLPRTELLASTDVHDPQDLLAALENATSTGRILSNKLRREEELRRSEEDHRASLLKQKRAAQDKFDALKKQTERNTYALVLINGDPDEFVFRDEFLLGGYEGGKKAAAELGVRISEYLPRLTVPSAELTIMVHVIADIVGLIHTLQKVGVTDPVQVVIWFVHGFNRRSPMMSFTNAGGGPDQVQSHIAELLRFHSRQMQCRAIMLGCCHNVSGARALTTLEKNRSLGKEAVLLEGPPLDGAIGDLGLSRRLRLDSVFRCETLDSSAKKLAVKGTDGPAGKR